MLYTQRRKLRREEWVVVLSIVVKRESTADLGVQYTTHRSVFADDDWFRVTVDSWAISLVAISNCMSDSVASFYWLFVSICSCRQ